MPARAAAEYASRGCLTPITRSSCMRGIGRISSARKKSAGLRIPKRCKSLRLVKVRRSVRSTQSPVRAADVPTRSDMLRLNSQLELSAGSYSPPAARRRLPASRRSDSKSRARRGRSIGRVRIIAPNPPNES
eukprot:373803_1